MAKCPLVAIEIGNERCPNRKCIWNTQTQTVKNGCIAIHEPQYEHLTVDELAVLKGIPEPSSYVTKTKHLIHLMVLFAEYVEYVRDNVGSCLRKMPKKRHRSVYRLKELSINKKLIPLVAHPKNFKRFYEVRKPVIQTNLYQLLNKLGESL